MIPEILQEKTLWNRSFQEVKTSPEETSVLSNQVVVLYFAASWCKACKKFTELLKRVYTDIKKHRRCPVQLIYVPFDNSEEDMKSFMQECHEDWLAVPFGDALIKELQEAHEITMVPKLIVLSSEGELLTSRGRKEIQDRGLLAFKNWINLANLQSRTDAGSSLGTLLQSRSDFLLDPSPGSNMVSASASRVSFSNTAEVSPRRVDKSITQVHENG